MIRCLLQSSEVFELKEHSAVALINQFFRSLPPKPKLWFYVFTCKTLDRPCNGWKQDCALCAFIRWVKPRGLPKELQVYCLNLIKKHVDYFR